MPESRTKKKPKTVVFYSRSRNLTVVRSPVNKLPTATGVQMDANPDPLSYSFAPDGRLEVTEGQDVRTDGREGAEQDAAGFLRSREGFNNLYFEEGAEPDRQLPTERELAGRITDAAMHLDDEALERIIEDEFDSHRRQSVLDQAHEALERVRERIAESEAVPSS